MRWVFLSARNCVRRFDRVLHFCKSLIASGIAAGFVRFASLRKSRDSPLQRPPPLPESIFSGRD